MVNNIDNPHTSHTLYGMKMTMHIDEVLLERVMGLSGCTNKTETVDFALKELDRIHKLREFAENGLGLTPEELKNAVDPDYNVLTTRVGCIPTTTNENNLKVAENSATYEKGDSSR